MTIKEIVAKHLTDNGFDGLVNFDNDCACLTEDLMPCNSANEDDCEPGYKVRCTEKCDHDDMPPLGSPDAWHIQTTKPDTKEAK